MKRIDVSAILLALAAFLYPVMAIITINRFGPIWLIGILCALLALRGALGWARKAPLHLTLALIGVACAMALTAAHDQRLSARLYPAFMNLALLGAFAVSLWRGPSMIERLARIHEPDLPPSGVRYTRGVTWVWLVFFALNGAIATWTALYAEWEIWALYNGLIAYLAMGVVFAIEFAIRQFVRKSARA